MNGNQTPEDQQDRPGWVMVTDFTGTGWERDQVDLIITEHQAEVDRWNQHIRTFLAGLSIVVVAWLFLVAWLS